jgi:phospholipid/cholesterol/gamma-HCH transport system substrate-binding protein
MSLLSTTNGPDPLDDALEQQLDRPAQLDDVMPVRTQGSLAMLTTSLVLLGGLFVAMAWIHRSPSSPGAVQFRTTDANGLQEGMEVRLSGFRIGQVDRIQLEPDAGVRVWLRIEPSYRRFLGPRSRVRMVQDTLIGPGNLAVSPDPDALRGRPENDLQRMPLRLAYSPSTNLPALLTAVAESRLPLNRFLNSSSRLLEGGLPKVMRSTDKAMTTARDLAADLRIQADRSEAELRSTAQATRRTLATYDDLGRQGIQRLAKQLDVPPSRRSQQGAGAAGATPQGCKGPRQRPSAGAGANAAGFLGTTLFHVAWRPLGSHPGRRRPLAFRPPLFLTRQAAEFWRSDL